MKIKPSNQVQNSDRETIQFDKQRVVTRGFAKRAHKQYKDLPKKIENAKKGQKPLKTPNTQPLPEIRPH